MGKETISVKSNGLRNELKEIRKSIDNLTNAIVMAQTHNRYEKSTIYHRDSAPDGMRWVTDLSTTTNENDVSGTD